MAPLIHVPVGVPPTQVDDFPSEVKEGNTSRPFQRSCKGALHLRPASTKTITADELQHIKSAKRHVKLAKRLSVVEVRRMPPRAAKLAAKAAAKPAAKPVVAPPPPVPHIPVDKKKDGK